MIELLDKVTYIEKLIAHVAYKMPGERLVDRGPHVGGPGATEQSLFHITVYHLWRGHCEVIATHFKPEI